MKPIIALTVSTKYEDILNIILPHNIKYFKKWYIVTHKDDTKTIQLIEKYNYENVEILFFDFYVTAKFNKGGAVEYGQQMIDQMEDDKDFNMLLLDSDILLPDNFVTLFETLSIEDGALYGAEVRDEYFTLDSYKNRQFDRQVIEPYMYFLGYFQLYKYNPRYKYSNSSDCSECDLRFSKLFPRWMKVNGLTVAHLGKAGDNWGGRLNPGEFDV
jgi:hypothetical protein